VASIDPIDMETFEKGFIAFVLAGAMIAVGIIGFSMNAEEEENSSQYLSNFSSYRDLANFLEDHAASYRGDYAYWRDGAPLLSGGDENSASHSETNIQVEGVDESDIVKTDGQYIYLVASNHVSIIKAYPPEDLANVSFIYPEDLATDEIDANRIYIEGVYLLPGKLIVLSSVGYYYYDYYYNTAEDSEIPSEPDGPWTMISVFDISDVESPVLIHSKAISGSQVTSRLVGDIVYIVTQRSIWMYSDSYVLPAVQDDGLESDMAPDEIYYDNETKEAGSFVNILAYDVGTYESNHMSVIAGWASTVYMSQDSLYFTVPKWTGEIVWLESELVPEDDSGTRTTIYKISVDGIGMDIVAKGEVRGWLLNQFSMDEKDSYLRIATTTDWVDMKNNVYVLNATLVQVGAVEDIAPDERIYAARFVGDTLYLVTFRQIDPLFVIDLSDPSDPKILGELVMPGFSSYLHPVDEDHVLGIGSENSTVKVALYDVSDPANPVETSKVTLNGSSWTMASYEHKAVLFDKEMELLVIPVSTYWYSDDWTDYGYWNGAIVFRVSIEEGISIRGTIEHTTSAQGYSGEIQRSLYIEDYLYTIGYMQLKVSSLDDLSEVGSIVLGSYPDYYYAAREA